VRAALDEPWRRHGTRAHQPRPLIRTRHSARVPWIARVIAHEKNRQYLSHAAKYHSRHRAKRQAQIGNPSPGWAVYVGPTRNSFLDQMTLHWGNAPVVLEHHPVLQRFHLAAFVRRKNCFCGDAVLKTSPHSSCGFESYRLDFRTNLLLESRFKGYTIISIVAVW